MSDSDMQVFKSHDEAAPGNHANEQVHSQQLDSTAGRAVGGGGVRGFNIAGHLRDSVKLDRSSGSLSPDVDQLLKDIEAMTNPPTPDVAEANVMTRGIKVQSSNLPDGTNIDQGVANMLPSGQNLRRGVGKMPPSGQNSYYGVGSMPPSVENSVSMLDPTDTSNAAKDPPQKPIKKLKLAIQLGAAHQNDTQKIDDHISNISSTSVPKLVLPRDMSPTHLNTKRLANSSIDPNKAAAKIQKWYRHLRTTRYASVKTVLREKKDELNKSRVFELERSRLEAEFQNQEEMAKKQRREAKMQATRQAAIDDLHKKREEKRLKTERIALEEIVS